MKLQLIIVIMLFGCSNSTSINSEKNTENIQIKVNNVVLYMDYSGMPITKYVNNLQSNIELYYEFDNEVANIINDIAYPIKVGEATVLASTINGKETSFTVAVRSANEFKYTTDVYSRIEGYAIHDIQANPTIFWGDSFFDTNNFWREFYEDFTDLNCYSVGISGSKASDWMYMRDRLIINYQPSNIVIHIGTNDVNDNVQALSIEKYYEIITQTIDYIRLALPQTNIYYIGIENRVNEAGGRNQYSTLVTEKIQNEYIFPNFFYVDTPSVFNLNQSIYMSSDNVHPSRAGYIYYRDILKQLIFS